MFLGGGGPGMSSRPYAEATQAAIDGEVSKLLRQAEERAVNLLKAHRPELDSLVDLLLERETVDGSDVYRLAGSPTGQRACQRRRCHGAARGERGYHGAGPASPALTVPRPRGSHPVRHPRRPSGGG